MVDIFYLVFTINQMFTTVLTHKTCQWHTFSPTSPYSFLQFTMPRIHKRKPGSRNYKKYTEETLLKAVEECKRVKVKDCFRHIWHPYKNPASQKVKRLAGQTTLTVGTGWDNFGTCLQDLVYRLWDALRQLWLVFLLTIF